MTDSTVIKLAQPGTIADSLTEILRDGARALLAQAVEAEVADFLSKHADLETDAGRQRIVRHGRLPKREIMTGIGPVAVRQPRVRDRKPGDGERMMPDPRLQWRRSSPRIGDGRSPSTSGGQAPGLRIR